MDCAAGFGSCEWSVGIRSAILRRKLVASEGKTIDTTLGRMNEKLSLRRTGPNCRRRIVSPGQIGTAGDDCQQVYHLSEQSMKCSIVDDKFKFLAIQPKCFVSEGGHYPSGE